MQGGAAAAAEEAAQLERAIAQSLHSAEQQRADRQHDESATLLGFIDSLHDADVRPQASSRAARPCSGEARRGRQIARQALEQHLVSGGAL